MAEIVATLKEVRFETEEAATLLLDLGGASFAYRAGQHLSIDPHQFAGLAGEIREREARRGKPLGPAYFSLSSDGSDPSSIEITVKGPSMVAAYFLKSAHPGEKVRLSGPGGKYGLPEAPPPGVTGFLHVCAGSGVAPNRGMIRQALALGWPQRHLLVVQDRTEKDALFRADWRDLVAHHSAAFRVRHVYSRTDGHRVSSDGILQAAEGFLNLEESWAFVCGPSQTRPDGPSFMDRVRNILEGPLGFPPDRIRTE